MDAHTLIQHFGTASAAARALGVSRQAVHVWVKKGIPALRALQVELAIKGVVKRPRARRPNRPGALGEGSDGIGVPSNAGKE